MNKKATDHLIEAGVIPEGTLQEASRWGTVDPETLPKVGSRPVSLETGYEARRLTSKVEKALEKESSTIRETEYYPPTAKIQVHLNYGGHWTDKLYEVGVDAQGRIHLDLEDVGKPRVKILGVRSQVGETLEVVGTEIRYEGDEPKIMVLTVED